VEKVVNSLGIGVVGTGFAAKLRVKAFAADPRCHLLGVAGTDPGHTQTFSQTHNIPAWNHWQKLLEHPSLDLVVIATVNSNHGAIAQAALQRSKHVVVEYPLALDVMEAEGLITLAQAQNRLLHVEHIERLGGLHGALLKHLPQIGVPYWVHYTTLKPEYPAPQRWTYRRDQFGFPLMGALSRIQRLTHGFGPVQRVSCQTRFTLADQAMGAGLIQDIPPYWQTCFCQAQLQFQNGTLGTVTYGKGEGVWQAQRTLTVQGSLGALYFDPDQGRLVTRDGAVTIEVAGRRGLFAQDTQQVLDHLWDQKLLYITPRESLYALRVADGARRAADTQTLIELT
jgi:biliverdin reductase